MMRHIYRPLKLCCCAASLWSLKFHDSWGVKAAEAPRHGMLSSLQHLQRLAVVNHQNYLYVVNLLNGINPPQLTKLFLHVNKFWPELMEPMLCFLQLRDLELWSAGSASLLAPTVFPAQPHSASSVRGW
eukprot:jgi/Botrbrau1/22115/Bobra.0206s0040.3